MTNIQHSPQTNIQMRRHTGPRSACTSKCHSSYNHSTLTQTQHLQVPATSTNNKGATTTQQQYNKGRHTCCT